MCSGKHQKSRIELDTLYSTVMLGLEIERDKDSFPVSTPELRNWLVFQLFSHHFPLCISKYDYRLILSETRPTIERCCIASNSDGTHRIRDNLNQDWNNFAVVLLGHWQSPEMWEQCWPVLAEGRENTYSKLVQGWTLKRFDQIQIRSIRGDRNHLSVGTEFQLRPLFIRGVPIARRFLLAIGILQRSKRRERTLERKNRKKPIPYDCVSLHRHYLSVSLHTLSKWRIS